MPTIQSTQDFDQRLDDIVKVAKAIAAKYRSKHFSIEVTGNRSVYITYIEPVWSSGYSKDLQELCDRFDAVYTISPLDGKLAVTISK